MDMKELIDHNEYSRKLWTLWQFCKARAWTLVLVALFGLIAVGVGSANVVLRLESTDELEPMVWLPLIVKMDETIPTPMVRPTPTAGPTPRPTPTGER